MVILAVKKLILAGNEPISRQSYAKPPDSNKKF